MPTQQGGQIRALAWAPCSCCARAFQRPTARNRRSGRSAEARRARSRASAARDCLGCHKAFADKYMGMKNVHAVRPGEQVRGLPPSSWAGREARHEEGRQRALLHLPCEGQARAEQGARPHRRQERQVRALPQPSRVARPTTSSTRSRARSATSATTGRTTSRRSSTRCCRRSGCSACHSSHGADQPNLLVKEEKALCLGCHPANAPAFTKAHGGYPVDQVSCSSCHSPHSSAQPKLLKTSVHAPVAAAQCETCHPAPTSGKPFEVNAEGRRAVRRLPRCRRHQGHREGAAPAVQGGRVPPVPQPPRIGAIRSCSRARGTTSASPATRSRTQAVAFKHAPVASDAGLPVVPQSALGRQRAAADGETRAALPLVPREDQGRGADVEGAARAGRGRRVHRLPRRARLERQGHPEGQDGPGLLQLPHGRRDAASSRPTRTSRSGTARAPRATSRTAPARRAC